MAFWLADKRDGQDFSYIQRFDPRFWTVDFPRPMMASVINDGDDEIRVHCEFYHQNELAGLIWASEDTLDHPLLAYGTDRDYSHTTLRFRWRSNNFIPLDQVHGPTLTIEGRDEAGNARSWYVRLWNYAVGTPTDAVVSLNFSELDGGFLLPSEADRVYPADIDRMFISLVPPGYTPGDSSRFTTPVLANVKLSEIRCEGFRATLEIGDVMVPPHGIQMATAYDDSYNQTPARLLRNIRGLGYRDKIIHYVGMSHFMRLKNFNRELLVDPDVPLGLPGTRWNLTYFKECASQGYEPIVSLSYELFAEYCPDAWRQLAHDGTPAETGWVPPSTLLSPANPDAMDWLKAVAVLFVGLLKVAGLPIRFQIGEPWWWVTPDRKICLYDAASQAAFGGSPPVIEDIDAALNQAQIDLLDSAGELLAQSTADLGQAVRDAAAPETAELLLLTFTPTILDPVAPELKRANLPAGWAYPAFDRLQVEDYDWLTGGDQALRRSAYEEVNSRLGYPIDKQDYLSGFVLLPADAELFWQRIDAGLDEARSRDIEELFVWALPQVNRDGYTRLAQSLEDDMQPFDDVLYPLPLGHDTGIGPEFSTSVSVTASGHERRSSLWSDARLRYDVGPGVRSENELGILLSFFRARRGAARGFRLTDPFDFSSNDLQKSPTETDQLIGVGDGQTADYQLTKSYGSGPEPQIRPITRPRADSLMINVDGSSTSGWSLLPGGLIRLDEAPSPGAEVRAGFLFDVPVRFAEDRLDISSATFAAGEAPSVPLVEIREAV